MARASAAAENAATNAVTALGGFISLHSADPGTTGASEIGSSTRGAVTWGASSAGTATNTNTVSVALPASVTATHFGVQSAVSAGTYEVGGVLGSPIAVGTTAASVVFAPGAITLATS